MFCSVLSADIEGITAKSVCVEADVTGGLPSFDMVGSLSSEVKEAKERVARAINNSGITIPPRKITINISPANIKKRGTGFDLAIAVAVLVCLEIIDASKAEGKMFVGELSLDGTINKVNGILPVAILAKEENVKNLIVPRDNAFEGAVIENVNIYGVKTLSQLIEQLNGDSLVKTPYVNLEEILDSAYQSSTLDYSDVNGQEKAKRATMIAVAGFHNLLYVGPPGSGKSMMARRIPTIFNKLTVEECLEISKIYSVIGKLEDKSLVLNRPFRSPHHSVTASALVGGMGYPKPGEITLAHKGILFLDEAAEFKKENIELLRQPLEDKKIVISRAKEQIAFPADFMLVMAMNPCKCGYYPDRNMCRCSLTDVEKYFGKIRGPILDRIDICVGTSKLNIDDFTDNRNRESSMSMREKILRAQEIQKKRFSDSATDFNSQMTKQEIEGFCILDSKAKVLLDKAYGKFNMTARGYYKVLKVARTIADMEKKEIIDDKHILEAVGYRNSYLSR